MKRLLLISLFALTGCGGIDMGDRHAKFCPVDFSDVEMAAMSLGFQEWNIKSNDRVDISLVSINVRGCIPITGTTNAPLELLDLYGVRKDDVLGWTHWGPDEDNMVLSRLSVFRDPSPEINLEAFQALVMHETGHYLTGGKHSPNRDDVMFSNIGQMHLTQADIDRLDYPGVWQ